MKIHHREGVLSRGVLLALCLLPWMGALAAAPPAVEDHTLPNSPVRTYHLKCGGELRLKARFDSRQEPVRLCTSARDGVRTQACVALPVAQVASAMSAMAKAECQ